MSAIPVALSTGITTPPIFPGTYPGYPGYPGGSGAPGGLGPGAGVSNPSWLQTLLGGGYGLATGIISGVADQSAAGALETGYGNAIKNWEATLGTQVGNQAPFLSAGQGSIADIMAGLQNGTFGPGSIPAFQAPTLQEAEATPGFQFAQEQGNKGILQGAAAVGAGTITGGTLQELDKYNVGLAENTYNDVYSRALSTYNTNLARQAQAYQQLFAPAQLGETSAINLNQNLGTGALNIGQLMSAIGAAKAGGILGATKDILSGGNSLLNSLLRKISGGGGPGAGAGGGPGAGGGYPGTPPFFPGSSGWPSDYPYPNATYPGGVQNVGFDPNSPGWQAGPQTPPEGPTITDVNSTVSYPGGGDTGPAPDEGASAESMGISNFMRRRRTIPG